MDQSRIDAVTGGSRKDRLAAITGGGPVGKRAKDRADELLGRAPMAPLDEALSEQVDTSGNPIAHPIWEGAKGLGRTVVDLISRPNYAVAGAAEELFTEKGGGGLAAIKRVGTELFSGVGSLQGQKEGFSQVMEQAGVGELGKLSDLASFLYSESGEGLALEKGGILDPTGRGFLGLAGDIFLDPSTYLTAGGKTASRFLTSAGIKYLSPAGRTVAKTIHDGFVADLKVADSVVDDVARIKLRSEIDKAYRSKVLAATVADPKLLDSTGIRWFGNEIVSRETLSSLNDTAKRAVLSIPGGARAAEAAAAVSNGVNRVFNAYADLKKLPVETREAAKGMFREMASAKAMHQTHLGSEWASIEHDYAKLAKTHGKGAAGKDALGKRFAGWRQGTGNVTPTPQELPVFQSIAKLYNDMETVLVREGIITPEQAAEQAGTYLHQVWKNADEALAETAKKKGRPIDRILVHEQIQKARTFKNIEEGIRISKELHAESLGFRQDGAITKVMGELIPEYDATKTLGDYIQQATDAIWKKRTYEEAASRFGKELGSIDPGRRYVLDSVGHVNPVARAAIDAAVSGVEKAGFHDLSLARRILPKLSNLEQKELARELMSRAKSPSQIINIRDALGEAIMPETRAIKTGEVDPFYATLGKDNPPVSVQGGLWGEKEIQLPAQIVKLVEGAPRDFIRDAFARYHLQSIVKAFDWYSDSFKMLAYPFYPSGITRDYYNNVLLSYLDIGVGAFARPLQAVKALRGSSEELIKGYTGKRLLTLAEDLGAIDRSGRSFIQFTGERGAEKAGLLAKARAKRAQVDNLSRMQLFVNHIVRGMDPEDAAQAVKNAQFDYAELSPFEHSVLKRAFPFYVFPRKAIEATAKAAVRTPGRLASTVKPFRGREDENNAMQTWEGEGFKLRLDRNGKDLTVLNGIDLPIRTLDLLWKGSPIKTVNGLLAMSSPAFKVPYEFVSEQDPFRGKPLGRNDSYAVGPALERLPGFVQRWAGYRKEVDGAGRTSYSARMDRIQVLAESALLSRVMTMTERYFREQARDPDIGARMLDFLTNFRLRNIDLDEEVKIKTGLAIGAIKDEMAKQGELVKGNHYNRPKKIK